MKSHELRMVAHPVQMDDNNEDPQTSYRYLFNGRFGVDGLCYRHVHEAFSIRGRT
jgi:hypothetical protein